MRQSSRWLVALTFLAIGVVGGFYANNRLIGQDVAPIPAELTSYRHIVKNVVPAVVSIETRLKTNVRSRLRPNDLPPNVPEEFRRFFDGEGLPTPDAPSAGFGSGFLVDPSGLILTNYHVIAGAESVDVTLSDGRKFTSKEIRGDKKTDLAIVRIASDVALPFLELGDSDKMEVGDRVLAVGAPFGLTGSVTHGIVSAKSRNLRMNVYEDFLQTDAAINPGNSGGPLVSLDGKVIGINSAIKSRSGGFQGVGLAISSNLVRQVKEQLQKEGVVRRGYLGVQIKDLTPEIAKALGLPDNHGVVVSRVMPDTPAEKSGLTAGDVVTSIAGKPVPDGRAMQKVVAGLTVNEAVDIQVVRDGQTQAVKVTIEEQPDEFGAERVPVPLPQQQESSATALDQYGLSVTDFNDEVGTQLGFRQSFKGALVIRVEPNSAAEAAGILRHMVVVRVDGKPIDSAAAFADALAKATPEKGALLQVRSATGGTDFLLLKVGK